MKNCLEYQILHLFFVQKHYIKNSCLNPPSWHCGGLVPEKALYTKENIYLLRIEMIPVIDIVHSALRRVNKLAKTKYDKHVGSRLITKIIYACNKRGVPQNFVPGIILLYLEHCEGCQWRYLITSAFNEDWSPSMVKSVVNFVNSSKKPKKESLLISAHEKQ